MNEVIDKDEHHDGPCEDHCGGIPGGDLLVSEFNGTLKQGGDYDARENIEFEEKNRIENDGVYCVPFTINIFLTKFKSCRNDTIFRVYGGYGVNEYRRVS